MDPNVTSDRAPEPVGAFPHARRVGNLLFLSGIGPRDRGRREIPGVTLDDTTGRMMVMKVLPGSPAYRAGLRPGDELRSIEGMPPKQWFASKAGWREKEKGTLAVVRGQREKELAMAYEAIPEEQFAKILGVHMLEGHLAYMPHDVAEEDLR